MNGPNRTSAVHDQAAEWFVRSQTPEFGPADWKALHVWLGADPSHLAAFEEIEQVWVDLDEADEKPEAQVIPLSVAPAVRRRGSGPAWLAAGVAVAASLVVAVLGVVRTTPPPPVVTTPIQSIAYRTAPGERKVFVLPDGSHVELNGGTRLILRMTGDSRQVAMAEGEAAFEVAHDAAHPFVIDLGDRKVQVVGTEFNILRQPSKLVVTVRQGVVAVATANNGSPPVKLTAGRQLIHIRGETQSTVHSVDPTVAYGWRSGQLSYSRTPFPEVADALSRYFGKTVAVDDDARGLLFTGVLKLDDERAVFARLELFLPIKAQISPDRVRLVRAAPR
jgi:transmembrane sensor